MAVDWEKTVLDFEQLTSSQRLSLIRDLVNRFDLDSYRKHQSKQYKLTQDIVEEFKKDLFDKVVRYDIFKELKVNFDENLVSDVIASIYNPMKYPIAKELIIGLLIQFNNQNIAEIITNTEKKYIVCKREVSGDLSRIDIRIFTKNIDQANAIIDIEMKGKNPVACETFSHGDYQTVREYSDLVEHQKKLVDKYQTPCSIAAFYVTPYGTIPKSNNFIAVSFDDMRNSINTVINSNIGLAADYTQELFIVKSFFKSSWLF